MGIHRSRFIFPYTPLLCMSARIMYLTSINGFSMGYTLIVMHGIKYLELGVHFAIGIHSISLFPSIR